MKPVSDSLDSTTGATESVGACEECGATARVGQGICANCLLRQGLEAEGEASAEVFESVLAEAEVPDTRWHLGNYEILEEIGRGGMGVIYRARQRHSRRIVALKRIIAYQADSHEALVRFRREAESAANLDHPHLLPIYEVGESKDGLPFFSMKYATGGSLRAAAPALRNRPNECVRLMAKVARAMACAHDAGILHRDLQPGNILLDGRGEPFVSDFGLAKWLTGNSDLTQTITTFGTPGYIAPEQAESAAGDLTPGADIYSLGAILFNLLAGRPPFVGENVLSVIHQAAANPAPKLRALAPSLDRDLETICSRCLERDARERYQTAGDLAEDLERWLKHEPIRARRSGLFTRGRKWVRRNPTTALLLTSLVALAAAVGTIVWKSEFVRGPVTTGIAVLPFENLSEEKESAFFADGVQDDILTKLAKVADLKVISRTSVMQYRGKQNTREIGEALRVSHVLEGSVRKNAGRIRLNAQLIDTRTDMHVWAEEYDRDLTDVFAIQTEIAQKIANQLHAKVSAGEKAAIEERPTNDLVAYDLYVHATSLIDKAGHAPDEEKGKDYFQAVELLNQAIARDPAFLLAYCRLAEAHDGLYFQRHFQRYDPTPRRLELAQSAIDSAFRLKPDSGEAHLALATHLYYGYFDYDRARDELAIAVRTLPNNARIFEWNGYIDRRQGRWHDAVRNFERASELDPRNIRILATVAGTYNLMRDYGRARETFNRLIALEPKNIDHQLHRAWMDLKERADTRPMQAVLEKMFTDNPALLRTNAPGRFFLALLERDPVAADRALAAITDNAFGARQGWVGFTRPYAEGLVARMKGDEGGARAAFSAARAEQEKVVRAQPNDGGALCFLGLIDAALGRKQEALSEGRQAVELLPVTKNALDGADILYFYAVICAQTGERDLAMEQLQTLAKIPAGVTYGEIRLDPFWDRLRGDPRFDKIVASLAPKEIASN